MSEPSAAPSLDALARDPTLATELRSDERRRLVTRLAALILHLESSERAAEPPRDTTAIREPEAERLLTVAASAERMGFAKSYVYELIRRGELRAVRRGKYVRVRASAIEAWVCEHET